MSIYREEAIDTLIDTLQKKDFPNLQLMTLDALASLSGKSYTEAWLLHLAGFNKPYEAFMENEKLKMVCFFVLLYISMITSIFYYIPQLLLVLGL